jgi:hypothetical protein
MQSADIAEKIKKLENEINAIEPGKSTVPKDQAPRLSGSKSLRRSPHPARSDSAGDQGTAENMTPGRSTPSEANSTAHRHILHSAREQQDICKRRSGNGAQLACDSRVQ